MVNDSKCSVQADEILIVLKLTKTHVIKKRILKVYSLTTKEHKTLQVGGVSEWSAILGGCGSSWWLVGEFGGGGGRVEY